MAAKLNLQDFMNAIEKSSEDAKEWIDKNYNDLKATAKELFDTSTQYQNIMNSLAKPAEQNDSDEEITLDDEVSK